jgi:hypothetical protein
MKAASSGRVGCEGDRFGVPQVTRGDSCNERLQIDKFITLLPSQLAKTSCEVGPRSFLEMECALPIAVLFVNQSSQFLDIFLPALNTA